MIVHRYAILQKYKAYLAQFEKPLTEIYDEIA